MRVIHTITTTTNIDNIPIVDGQILALWDTDAWYYDMNGRRRSVSGVKFLDELPPITEGIEGIVYVVGTNLYKFTSQDGYTLLSNIDDSGSSPASTYSSQKIDQLLQLYIPKSEKAQPEGVATLGPDGIVPESQLPGWCKSLVIVDKYSDLPVTGSEEKAYLVKEDNKFYQWVDSEYQEIGLVTGHDAGTAYPGDEGLADHAAIQGIGDRITAIIARISTAEENIRNLQLADISLQGQIDQIPINYLVHVNNVETDLASALAILDKPSYHNADLLVLVDAEKNTQGYVYDATNDEWNKLSGEGGSISYDANNIYFTNDIVCAGDYTQVGNITKELEAVTSIPAQGKSLAQVMDIIFKKELQPTKENPKITINLTAQEELVEVGSNVAVSYTAVTDTGSYTYDSTTGSTISDVTIQDGSGTYVTHSLEGTFPPLPVIEAEDQYTLYHTALSVQGTITYTQGNIAKTNLGNDSDPVVQITAGQTTSSEHIRGRRSLFYGVVEYQQEITAQVIRGLTNVVDYESQSGQTFTVNVSDSGVQDPGAIAVAIPADGPVELTISNVRAEGYFEPDITSEYELLEDPINVPGANNFTAVPYNVWVFEPDMLYLDDVHHITLS